MSKHVQPLDLEKQKSWKKATLQAEKESLVKREENKRKNKYAK